MNQTTLEVKKQFFPRKKVFEKELSPIRIEELHSLMKYNTSNVRKRALDKRSPFVQIRYTTHDKMHEGMGFVVMEDDDFTYILTAQHVISQAYEEFSLVTKIEDLMQKVSLNSTYTKQYLTIHDIRIHDKVDLAMIICVRNKNITFDIFPISTQKMQKYDIAWSYRNSFDDVNDAIYSVYYKNVLPKELLPYLTKQEKKTYFLAQNKLLRQSEQERKNDAIDVTNLHGLSGYCLINNRFEIVGLVSAGIDGYNLLECISSKVLVEFVRKHS